MTRLAIVEPFLGGSHEAWAKGYAEHSSFDVTVFGHPPMHWAWRMQGAHVTLAERITADVAARGEFDVLLCSDMVDVAGLLGVLRGRIGTPRVVLYMHENQLTFPLEPGRHRDLTYAMTNWTSMVAADLVVFNSAFHRDEWFGALPGFLRRFPDERHTSLIERVRERTVVMPVGVDVAAIRAQPLERRPRPLLLWNQRWQWDKGCDTFADVMRELAQRSGAFDVAIAGDRGEDDAARSALHEALRERVVHDGFASTDDYRRLLRTADVVVSTARHEFFGIGVVEAIAAGAFPILPNGLAYREHLAAQYGSACLYDDRRGLLERLERALDDRDESRSIAADLAANVDRYDWSTVAADYDAAFG